MHAPLTRVHSFVRRALALAVTTVFVGSALVATVEVAPVGATSFLGSAARLALNAPVTDMAATPTGKGYWLVAADGGVFNFGDAKFAGSAGRIALHAPVVGIASTSTGRGYWLAGADGGVFAFGDAAFRGSAGGLPLRWPVVAIAATPSGKGYWLAGADGGVFAFGDAGFYGSTGGMRLNQPVVGIAATPSGNGYWLAGADGGVFAFGDAGFYGSTGNIGLAQPVVRIAGVPGGGGYWMVAADGGVFSFGRAKFYGSAAGSIGSQAVVDIAAAPGGGYWIATQWGAVDTATSTGFKVDPNLLPRNPQEAIAIEMMLRINQERAGRGLPSVFYNPMLSRFASAWAYTLLATNAFVHQNLLPIIYASQGLFEGASENMYAGSGGSAVDAGSAHIALMNSPSHRTTILLPEQNFVGVGVACARGRLVLVEDFGILMGVPLPPRGTPPRDPVTASDQGGWSCPR